MLDLKLLRSTHEDHPVVGEALGSGLLSQLGTMPQLQLHLDRTLERKRKVGGGLNMGWSEEHGGWMMVKTEDNTALTIKPRFIICQRHEYMLHHTYF